MSARQFMSHSDSKNLLGAIERVFAFFAIFNLPLQAEKVQRYLSLNATAEEVEKAIVESGLFMAGPEGYVFKKHDSEINRNCREALRLLEDKVEANKGIFRHLPFVRFVAVCNNLSFGVSRNGSDIDLFVITRKDRIFTARFIMTIIFHLLGIRRHKDRISGRFCLSFFVTEDNLNLTPIRIENDIYLDYWLVSLRPVYGDMMSELRNANHTTFRKFPNNKSEIVATGGKSLLKRMTERFLNRRLGNVLEDILKKIQISRYKKAKPHIGEKGSLVVNDKMLKFHNLDRRAFYRDQYERNLRAFP